MTTSADRIEQALSDIQWSLGDGDFNVIDYRRGHNSIQIDYEEGPSLIITVETA
jgi:hypothetical protein